MCVFRFVYLLEFCILDGLVHSGIETDGFKFLAQVFYLNSFFINTISLIDQRDYIMGLIYPEPFFDNTKHGTRATKYL